MLTMPSFNFEVFLLAILFAAASARSRLPTATRCKRNSYVVRLVERYDTPAAINRNVEGAGSESRRAKSASVGADGTRRNPRLRGLHEFGMRDRRQRSRHPMRVGAGRPRPCNERGLKVVDQGRAGAATVAPRVLQVRAAQRRT